MHGMCSDPNSQTIKDECRVLRRGGTMRARTAAGPQPLRTEHRNIGKPNDLDGKTRYLLQAVYTACVVS